MKLIIKSRNPQDIIPGGLADGKTDKDFDPEALAAGVKVEMEHTSDPKIAHEIARDHLTEDPSYYKKLAKMEAGGKGKVEKAGAAEPGYYDPEQIKIKREDAATKRGEPGEIQDEAEDQPSFNDPEAVDPGAQQEAEQKARDKAEDKGEVAKAGFGPGGGFTGSEVSPVDTGEDYTPKTSRGDEMHDPLEFHRPDQKPEWVEVGPTRGGANQFKPWSEVVGAKVPMIGHPYMHLRQFTNPEEREEESKLLARSLQGAKPPQEPTEQPPEPQQPPQEAPQPSQEVQPPQEQPPGAQEALQEPQGQPEEMEVPEEDPQAVVTEGQKLLSMVPKLTESQLRVVAKRIWGDDYEYASWASEEYIREHVTGSIMDMVERALRTYRDAELGDEVE